MKSQLSKAGFPILLIVCLSMSSLVAQEASRSFIGVSNLRPNSGPYVEIDGKFMVPYETTIPGSNISFEMIPIPGGKFLLGSPPSEDGRQEDEGPQVAVEVQPMWVSKTEVTWGEYRLYMDMYTVFKLQEKKRQKRIEHKNDVDAVTAPTPLYEASHTFEFGDDPKFPAVTMTQYAAKQYTKWLSLTTGHQYRLPTESEWEYAARAGSQTAYCFGDSTKELDQYSCYWENSGSGPNRVGSKKANAFGLHDMHGNVWEWTIEGYTSDGYKTLDDRIEGIGHAVKLPKTADNRCVRGGGFQHSFDRCRSASRMGSNDEAWKDEDPDSPGSTDWFTSDPSKSVGFRIVRSWKPLGKEAMKLFWEYDHPEIKESVMSKIDDGRGAIGIPDKRFAK